jgi:type VI secretion system secreted protein VgrG
MTYVPVHVRLESDSFPCEGVEVARLTGRERISRLFQLDVDIVADAHGPTRQTLAGATATLVFEREGQELRRLHGMIAQVRETFEGEGEAHHYHLRFVPRAHRLTLVESQEIYMDLSVPDILRRLFEQVELGGDVDMDLLGEHRKQEFVVQYKESDLAFASRLAEHHGLSFHFLHEDGRDRVVFTDGQRFPKLESPGKIPLHLRGEKHGIFHLEVETGLIPMTYAVVDYNYRNPALDLTAVYESPQGFAGGVAEYGTHVKTPAEAAAFAKIRAEERECGREVYVGKSDVCELFAGAKIDVEGGKREDLSLLVVEVEHRVSQVTRVHGGEEVERYENTFRAVPASVVYRPARVTPRPKIAGVVSGIIEQRDGASTRYARIDKQGRYRVRFLFDTAAPGERKASRPVRMAQFSSGAGMGMHFPLRPGTEVLLAFVDGDPDRPIILSSIPNAITPSPVTASNSLKNQIKTASGVLLEIKDS